jgi:signal transduction histidine kinase
MATMDSLVVAYILLVLLTLVAAGLWAYARGVERRAAEAEAEQALELAALAVLREHAPCGILQLNDAREISRPTSATTRRILRQACDPGTGLDDSLRGIVAPAVIGATYEFLDALCNTREPTPEFLANHPLSRVVLEDRELFFRFHRIGADNHKQAVLVTIEELRAPAAAPARERTPEWLQNVLALESGAATAFLGEAAARVAQIRAIVRMPTRAPRAFREKVRKLEELVAALHRGGEQTGIASVVERADAFNQLLVPLETKAELTGNEFLPLAQALDELVSHLEELRGSVPRAVGAAPAASTADAAAQVNLTTVVNELAQAIAAEHKKVVKVVTVGLEDVPHTLQAPLWEMLQQLVRNSITHGIELPLERVKHGKPSRGTLVVQFRDNPVRGYELSFQDDGRGLDYERIRELAVARGVLTPQVAEHIDPRKLASLIFRPGFSTAVHGQDESLQGIGMHLVRERATDLGGKVGVATRPGEFTRFRIVLPIAREQRVA